MHKIYSLDDGRFIAYKQHKSKKNSLINIVFLHGMMSNMAGKKSNYLHHLCQEEDLNFLAFDNYGHGNSSGRFIDQTIESWFDATQAIMYHTSNNFKNIIVGSSLGGWLAMLAAVKNNIDISGVVALSPAIDFTETLIWNKLTEKNKYLMVNKGYIELSGNSCNSKYSISYNLISNARKYLLLNKSTINIQCPLAIIHGMQDQEVPYQESVNLINRVQTCYSTLKLLRYADHFLSDPASLSNISYAIKEIMQQINS
ncbi:dienelactone hydrolase family protein [Orientia chuto str. Dubai]|uniref:Dienelactone hydrolase family protein n=1 Tax=Orientia chuto str. Dubai TaxID=1359168 RepID=A0A0F3MLW2_9RICK|nr:alpha/beta hydrolase [Candidatus Orientia mediorientalis]KJV56763.1 dienelactone hydrolase family protein [Orientia chuto str. Dubai]